MKCKTDIFKWYAEQSGIYVRIIPGCPKPMTTPCSDGGWNVVVPSGTRESEERDIMEELWHILNNDHEKADVQDIEKDAHK